MSAIKNKHADPAIDQPPDRSSWPAYWQATYDSPLMRDFRAALQLNPETSVRDSVIDDLCAYYHCSPEECLDRCVNWGRYFDEEWDTAGSPAEFHRSTTSSSYSLLWWGYCQSEGFLPSPSIGAADAVLRAGVRTGEHLDFGAATGITSQLFARLGFRTTLADISSSMLAFARFRFERRGVDCTIIDLNEQSLPARTYDVITALAVLDQVPDFKDTVRRLHNALKPGGVLYADISPSAAKEARWEVHTRDLPLRRQLQAGGFEPIIRIPWGGTLYRRVPRRGPMHAYRVARDAVLLSPLRQTYRNVRDRMR